MKWLILDTLCDEFFSNFSEQIDRSAQRSSEHLVIFYIFAAFDASLIRGFVFSQANIGEQISESFNIF